MKSKKTVYAVALIVNPMWGLRDSRNSLSTFEELKLFTTEKSLFKYLEDHGFEPQAKTQYLSAKAVEIRKRTV